MKTFNEIIESHRDEVDKIEFNFIKGMMNPEEINFLVMNLFAEDVSDRISLKIFNDYILDEAMGNLILYKETDEQARYDYRIEINLTHETATLVSSPKRWLQTDTGLQVEYWCLLKIMTIKYLKAQCIIEMINEKERVLEQLKYEEGIEELTYEELRHLSAADFEPVQSVIEKIDQFKNLVNKTCLRHLPETE